MDYWHIQMHLPKGREDKVEIDPLKMLREPSPVIGIGEWDDIQCQYFKGETGGLKPGSIVMVRRGAELLALVKVVSGYFENETLEEKYIHRLYRLVEILDWKNERKTSSLFSQGTLKVLYEKSGSDSWNYINDWYQKTTQMTDLKSSVDLVKFKRQIILQGPPGTGKTFAAKDIAEHMIFGEVSKDKNIQKQNLGSPETKDQFKLIQFHPSYSYEDFVRGIVAKPNPDGEGVIYECENKTLAAFAKTAWENYNLSVSSEKHEDVRSDLQRFISFVIEKIDTDGKFSLTDNVYIFYVDNKRFKYKGDNWTAHPNGLNMNFSELEKIMDSKQLSRPEINKNKDLNELTRQHATYYTKLVENLKLFLKKNPKSPEHTEALKNYVLIIDEINRANLSSVLGELIYALEYRGETVESMYEVDGSNQLLLPPNLYIIGTMNTAVGGVGHIDYAIRRRFAFVEVAPKDLSSELGDKFHKSLFDTVSNLFTNNLSPEFEKNDVQLGHSYFIDKSEEGGSMTIRLEYEIKPILREYVKDGILIGESIREKIENLQA